MEGPEMEDIKHFILHCEEFEHDRLWSYWVQSRGLQEQRCWVKEYEEGDDYTCLSLLLGRIVDIGK